MNSTDTAYGTVAVTLHWLSAAAIIVLIGSGFRSGLATDPAIKTALLRLHIPVALLVLALTGWRLFRWWRSDRKPAPLGTSPAWQEAVAVWTHRLLYVLLVVMLASGLGLSILSGAPAAVFGAAPLPDFTAYAPRQVHGLAALLLVGLIALHGAAALYHHFVQRDVTLKRMWFGAVKK